MRQTGRQQALLLIGSKDHPLMRTNKTGIDHTAAALLQGKANCKRAWTCTNTKQQADKPTQCLPEAS